MGRTLSLVQRGCIACIVCADVCFSFLLRFLGPVLVLAANGERAAALLDSARVADATVRPWSLQGSSASSCMCT